MIMIIHLRLFQETIYQKLVQILLKKNLLNKLLSNHFNFKIMTSGSKKSTEEGRSVKDRRVDHSAHNLQSIKLKHSSEQKIIVKRKEKKKLKNQIICKTQTSFR
jgi:hypothetical protein